VIPGGTPSEEVFTKVFGFTPQSKVGLRIGPISVHMQLASEDFQSVLKAYTESAYSAERGALGGGLSIPYPKSDALKKKYGMTVYHAFTVSSIIADMVAVLLQGDEDVPRKHEQQHALLALIRLTQMPDVAGDIDSSDLVKPVAKLSKDLERANHLGVNLAWALRIQEAFLTRIRWAMDEQVKDEIFAYSLAEQMDWQEIITVLTDHKASLGSYDFTQRLSDEGHEITLELISDSLAKSGLTSSEIAILGEEYHKAKDKLLSLDIQSHRTIHAVDAYRALTEALQKVGFGRQEAMIILSTYPIRSWQVIVKTLTC